MDPQQQIAEITRSVQAIIAAATENRSATDARLADLDKTRTALVGQLTALEQKFAESQLAISTRPAGGRPGARAAAIVELFKGHEQELAALAERRGIVTLTAPSPIQTRAIVGDLTSGSPSGGFPVAPVRDHVLYAEAQRPLTLLQALPSLPMSAGNTHEHVKVTDPNSPDLDYGAGVQTSEGADKPEAAMQFDLAQTPIDTIAIWSEFSLQLLRDVPQLQAEISALFMHSAASSAERRFASSLSDQAVVYTGASGDLPTKLSQLLAALEARGYVQPLVLMNPYIWHTLRTTKAAGGSEEFLAGTWSQPAEPNVWGAPVIRNAAIGLDEVIVVDASAARILDRQAPTVEFNTLGAGFKKNLVEVRAELRAAIEITRAMGVAKLPLT